MLVTVPAEAAVPVVFWFSVGTLAADIVPLAIFEAFILVISEPSPI